MYTCPVCYYTKMREAPADYNICECCGTEFGNDDEFTSHDELREEWAAAGAPWFFRNPPVGWNPWTQLLNANVGLLPYYGAATPYGSVSYGVQQSLVEAGPISYEDARESYAIAA